MRYAIAALALLLCACPHHSHQETAHEEGAAALAAFTAAAVQHEVRGFDTKCWSLADWNTCSLTSCNDNNECCSREKLGCTAHACGANGCEYHQDTADVACTCMPGECSADGKSVCGCTRAATGAGSDSVASSALEACPPYFPTCDPTKRTCVCDPAKKSCTENKRGHTFCNGNGEIETSACPESTPLCENGDCICSPLANQECGCGGHYNCLGVCDHPTCAAGRTCQAGSCCDPKFGQGCGSCGGHYDCNGHCDVDTPSDLNGTCNECGGTRRCGGGCLPAQPANLHQQCNQCGGTWQCNGSCLPATNFGQPCGECGGTSLCNGACTRPMKRCPVDYAPDAEGMCRSNLHHKVYSNRWSLGGVPANQCGTHCGCMMDESFDIAIPCGPTGTASWTRADVSSAHVEGGHGSCEASFATGDERNCSVRVHFNTKAPFPLLCEHFTCQVEVSAQDRIPQCSR